MRTLSVVIPIKDECANLRPLHERLRRALDPLCAAEDGRPPRLTNYEILIVDDGSKDGSFAVLQELAAADPRLKVVRLRRNFGQTPALRAGIDAATGDVLVTMDGDLQNDPADIPLLLDKLDEGYDAVFGLRANRQDHLFIRKLPSLIGNWLIRRVTGVRIRDMGCTLRACDAISPRRCRLYGELHRFVPVLAKMHGASIVQIPVRHHARVAGKTKYGLTRTVRVLLDLITVKFLHTYLTRPMHVLGTAGLVSMGLGARQSAGHDGDEISSPSAGVHDRQSAAAVERDAGAGRRAIHFDGSARRGVDTHLLRESGQVGLHRAGDAQSRCARDAPRRLRGSRLTLRWSKERRRSGQLPVIGEGVSEGGWLGGRNGESPDFSASCRVTCRYQIVA